jgi:hypothetical protein
MKERHHLEDLGLDGRIILNRILHKRMRKGGQDSSESGQAQAMGSCKDCNETSGSIK